MCSRTAVLSQQVVVNKQLASRGSALTRLRYSEPEVEERRSKISTLLIPLLAFSLMSSFPVVVLMKYTPEVVSKESSSNSSKMMESSQD